MGTNLAATPGHVVFRNDLMELIQYAPSRPSGCAPSRCWRAPPWINKYYVMDLAPGRSFIEWAVQHQRTVFAISYRNPDASMRDVTLDDYLIHGPRIALDVISDITGSGTVDIVGLCLGGALTAMLAAYLAGTGDARIGSITLLNTLLDYSEPGVLGAFADEQTISRLETEMARTGVMEGAKMAGTFDALRANDLIFNYVVSNWLIGKSPPAFDILAWNADSTRLPAAMHSFYLRTLYAHNQLAKGEMEDSPGSDYRWPTSRTTPTSSARSTTTSCPGHRGTDKATGMLGGSVRYVLSSGGHIAGIVNPPGPKAWYEVARRNPEEAARWREAAEKHSGSWWQELGILGGRTRRPLWPGAADGQRALSSPRRGTGRLRPRLT